MFVVLGTLGGSLFGNMVTCKGVMQGGEGVI